MEKINWKRVLIGGLVAGLILLIIYIIITPIALKINKPVLDIIGQEVPTDFSMGDIIFGIVFCFAQGIIAIWFYSAIRPRFGAGPKTALIAGFFLWFYITLMNSANSLSATGYIPFNTFLLSSFVHIVPTIVATLVGAWVYKES